MHLHLFALVLVVDDPLEVEDNYFWQLVEVGPLVDLVHLLVALFAKVVRYFFLLRELSETIHETVMALDFDHQARIVLVLVNPILADLTFDFSQFLYSQNLFKLFELVVLLEGLLSTLNEAIEELMSVLLDGCVDRLALEVLERIAELLRNNVFFLTVLQQMVQLL